MYSTSCYCKLSVLEINVTYNFKWLLITNILIQFLSKKVFIS